MEKSIRGFPGSTSQIEVLLYIFLKIFFNFFIILG